MISLDIPDFDWDIIVCLLLFFSWYWRESHVNLLTTRVNHKQPSRDRIDLMTELVEA